MSAISNEDRFMFMRFRCPRCSCEWIGINSDDIARFLRLERVYKCPNSECNWIFHSFELQEDDK